MAIFEKTFNAANELDNVMTAARETYTAAKKEILATFKSPAAEAKLAEAKKVFEAAEMEQRQKALEAVQADFADARSKINAVVTAAAPADFAATLEAIRAKGERISDYECLAFIEKYKGNYLAFSTIADVLHQVRKALEVIPCKPDEIDNEITELEKMVRNWIQNYKGGDYMTALLTAQQHTPILKTGAMVQAFLDGGFIIGDDEQARFAAYLAKMNG